MRLALVLALVAMPVLASAAEDRYGAGPATPALSSDPDGAAPVSPAPYRGRFLQWAGKTTPAPQPTPVAAPLPPVQPVASLPAAPPPQIFYAPPVPPAPRPASAPMAAIMAPAPMAPLPAAPPAAAPLPPAPAAKLALAAAPPPSQAGWVHSRFYSLHREYGDTPDAVALPVNRPPVLIGPGDGGAASVGDDPSGDDKAAKAKPPSDSDGVY
ncbi:MAG TPA: hypothetical protein VII73_03560 [Caulobacteraceae bacterium]